MACECCCLGKLFHLMIIYGYPAYKILKPKKKDELEKLWIVYFFLIGILAILESTILFPIILILGKIGKSIYPTIKVLFHLWLYYPEYRGALLIEQKLGRYIDIAFLKLNPLVGKFLTLIGIQNKDIEGDMKKNE